MATVALVVAVVIGSVDLDEGEPRHKGKPLSYWIQKYWYFDAEKGIGAHEEARQALEAIGTNAFPFLLRWIHTPEARHHPAVLEIAAMLPNPLRPKWARNGYIPHSARVVILIGVLENEAAPLVPELERIAADPNNADGAENALLALVGIGSNGVPALLAAIRDPSHPQRIRAVYGLVQSHDLGPYTNRVISELVAQLDDPGLNGEPGLALSSSEIPPEIVAPTLVPALAGCLQNTNNPSITRIRAAIALADFHEWATNALPALTNALNDPDVEVRKQAANAIQEIHGEAAKIAPDLLLHSQLSSSAGISSFRARLKRNGPIINFLGSWRNKVARACLLQKLWWQRNIVFSNVVSQIPRPGPFPVRENMRGANHFNAWIEHISNNTGTCEAVNRIRGVKK
jgi:HEAT repeat protein